MFTPYLHVHTSKVSRQFTSILFLVEIQTVVDILGKPCKMPSDTHNNLQIHHRVYIAMNKLCLDRYASDHYPSLLLVGWVNFCLFTAGSHLYICVYIQATVQKRKRDLL